MKKHKKYFLGVYEITYTNGFKQQKILVSNENYNDLLKPLDKAINIIEDNNNKKPTNQSISLKNTLNFLFEDYKIFMTEDSPLGKSIKTGILSLPQIQGGEHNVKWRKIK